MAFADVLFHETDATLTFVDRHHGPGGHWNDAYPFVRLHQPSAYYGVNSKALGGDLRDKHPLNAGMRERATAAELIAYYEQLMQTFVASGRVRYLPMHDYVGDYEDHHEVTSLMNGETSRLTVNRKVVDTTFMGTEVPSTHPPKYAVARDVKCIPINALSKVSRAHSGYVVVGAGKTGVDACLWLLDNNVSPDKIHWIMPRDSWFLNRANAQPGNEFFETVFDSLARQLESIATSASVDELFGKLEAGEQLLRLDPSVTPSMFHGALMSKAELHALRAIKNVIRLGRVKHIEPTRIEFVSGEIAADSDWLYVDCSASAAKPRAPVPVFTDKKIVPQMVRMFQPTFSAAMIAHVEATIADTAEKNSLWQLISMPDKPIDWLKVTLNGLDNQQRWNKVKGLREWILASRLDGFTAAARSVKPDETERMALLQRYGRSAPRAAATLQALLQS